MTDDQIVGGVWMVTAILILLLALLVGRLILSVIKEDREAEARHRRRLGG